MRRLMLREEDQVYFLHIPKTAGISLFNILYRYLPDDERPHYTPRDLLNPPERLLRQRLIVGHTYYTLQHYLPRPPVCVTMLREPVAQVVSHFRHIQREPDHFLHTRFHNKTLLDFLHDPDMDRLVRNYQTLNLAVDADPRVVARNLTPEQIEFPGIGKLMLDMYDQLDEQELVERVKARLRDFAFVGVTERFNELIELLTYTFHWLPSPTLHMNRDPQPPDEISQEAREWIVERTQLDLQIYQFALQLMETRCREMTADLLHTDYLFAASDTTDFVAHWRDVPNESLPYLQDSQGWTDGWVGPHWVVTGLPPQMRELNVTGTTMFKHLKPPLRLTVVSGGKFIKQIEIKRGHKFSLRIPLTGAPVEVLADQFFIPAQYHESNDARPLSWRILAMNLTS